MSLEGVLPKTYFCEPVFVAFLPFFLVQTAHVPAVKVLVVKFIRYGC